MKKYQCYPRNRRASDDHNTIWHEYAAMKMQWRDENPGSTPVEYDAAIQKIITAPGI